MSWRKLSLVGPQSKHAEIEITRAWQNVVAGRATSEEAQIAFADLAARCGYYEPPSLVGWLAAHNNSIAGFDLFCVQRAGLAELFKSILMMVEMDDAGLLRLERAAIAQLSIPQED